VVYISVMSYRGAPVSRPTYIDGPNESMVDIYRDGYRDDPSVEAADAAGLLAASIDHWLCGPYDDGDEGQEYILGRAVERAARFIAEQPCTCGVDLCARCMAIGCGYGEHKTPACTEGGAS
jgi:hypothetical protein